jgi:hypothetical protein
MTNEKMTLKEVIRKASPLATPFRVSDGSSFRLRHMDPADTLHLNSEDKPLAKEALQIGVQALTALKRFRTLNGNLRPGEDLKKQEQPAKAAETQGPQLRANRMPPCLLPAAPLRDAWPVSGGPHWE